MRKLMNIPLLLIPYIIYHLVALGEDKPDAIDTNQVMSIDLPSGAEWIMTTGHIVLILGLFFLVLEILKATWTTSNSPIIDHVASWSADTLLVGVHIGADCRHVDVLLDYNDGPRRRGGGIHDFVYRCATRFWRRLKSRNAKRLKRIYE